MRMFSLVASLVTSSCFQKWTILTLSFGDNVSSTVSAASLASLILNPLIEPLRSIIITKFFLTGEAVSTYHDLSFINQNGLD